jgi:hypothetical protein
MSAWKKPSRNTCVKKMVTPSRASWRRSTPAATRRSTWLMGTPVMRSITITSGCTKSQYISGISTRCRPCMLRRSCAALAASRTRSSSSCRYLSNSATTSRVFRRRASTDRLSTQPAIMRMRSRSFSITGSMPGRSTLTATSRTTPSRVRTVAKWTWAIEALATGSCSKVSKTAASGRRKARSMVATATSDGNGGTRSCKSASSSAMSCGSRSRRVDSTWPNLTKMGPRCSSAWRRRWPRGASRRRPKVTSRASPRSRKPESASSSSP